MPVGLIKVLIEIIQDTVVVYNVVRTFASHQRGPGLSGAGLCSEGSFSVFSSYTSCTKTNTSEFQIDLNRDEERALRDMCYCKFSYLFIYLFIYIVCTLGMPCASLHCIMARLCLMFAADITRALLG